MKKVLCIVLALLMTAFVFASCDTTQTQSEAGSTSTGTTSTTSDAELFSSLRDWDGEEAVVMFLVGGMQYGERYHSREIGAEELNNELINDAVFNRNALVEDKFNIDIQAYATSSSENINTIISNEIGSNLYTYDVVMPIMNDMVSAAADGYFYDLFDSEITADLDLSKEWWDQKAVADLSIGDSLYFTTGYMSILDNECTQVLIFNKTLVKNNELESPYTLVKSGDWTYDKMMELAANVT
ncbi:MAG TPA: extracellular solute-binding protein, partial [Bacillota bacterium]|nr:extracellular solute-binding protein [Bacillota bacterium]